MRNSLLICILTSACGSTADPSGSNSTNSAGGPLDTHRDSAAIKHVFVIAMENQDGATLYGNSKAPYINDTLMQQYSYGTRYGDDYQHPDLPSEPHYIQMEAGSNAFSDHTFKTDEDPSVTNSTASTDHLVTQMAAINGASWMAYQEDMPDACPVASQFPYFAKHDPFVFFRDVSFTNGGPDKANEYCAAHHKDYATSFAGDLAADSVATYNFITPNTCNDMHGDVRCSNGCRLSTPGYGPCIAAGDKWLKRNLPPIIEFAANNQGVVFIVWDEAEETAYAPFLAIGPHLKTTGAVATAYTHASLLKSLQKIVGVPVSDNVAAANDFADLFETGYFP